MNEFMNFSAEAEIKRIVSKYFGEASYKLSITIVGRNIYLNISYTDFKPKRQVRREIEDLIPLSDVTIDDRFISDEALFEVFKEEQNKEMEIYIPGSDGRLRSTNLNLYLEDILIDRAI